MRSKALLSVLLVIALSGCASSSQLETSESSQVGVSPSATTTKSPSRTPSPTSTPVDPEQSLPPIPPAEDGETTKRTSVTWETYPAQIQVDIDAETAASNCKALESRLGEVPQNSDIFKYLFEALEIAGC